LEKLAKETFASIGKHKYIIVNKIKSVILFVATINTKCTKNNLKKEIKKSVIKIYKYKCIILYK
jgi:hypothetical protein